MPSRRIDACWAVTALAAGLVPLGLVTSDSLWLVPLGRLVAHGELPSSLPYSTAATRGWHDVPALAELLLWSFYSLLGDRGLLLLQMLAATVGWATLAHGLRRQGSSEGSSSLVALLVVVGCLPVLLNTRSYLFSLTLFPMLWYLIEEDGRQPSRRLWLAVPLLALWSNLHGAVLVGWVVLLIYLALSRLRRDPGTTVLLALSATAALSLTAALWETPSYYWNVLGNEAAHRHIGLWGRLSLNWPSLLLAGSAIVLLVFALRGRPARWESVLVVALGLGTIYAARIGPWLLFVCSYPAARGIRLRDRSRRPRFTLTVIVILLALALISLGRVPRDAGAGALAHQAAESGLPVLASDFAAEQVEADGGRVWVANPIDAFGHADQSLYLDWLTGKQSGERAVIRAGLILVPTNSPQGRAAAHDPRLHRLRTHLGYALYRVRKR